MTVSASLFEIAPYDASTVSNDPVVASRWLLHYGLDLHKAPHICQLIIFRRWCVKINHVEGSARWSLDAESLCFAKFLIRYQPVEHSESKARRLPAIPYREVGCAHFVLCFEIWPLCSMPTHIAPCGHACFGDTLHHHRRQVCVYAPDFAHTKNRRIGDLTTDCMVLYSVWRFLCVDAGVS